MFRKKSKLPMNWSKIEASAPGKFVLIGDFHDISERNVIGVAIDRRLRVIIRPHKHSATLRLRLNEFDQTWEWPTGLHLFTMTKIVANYADPLVQSDYTAAINRLRPLLNEKYRLESDVPMDTASSPQHLASQTMMQCDLPSPPSSANDDCDESETLTKPHESKKQHNHDLESALGANRDADSETSLRERYDLAVLSFLLLYISIGDSFGSSTRPALDIEVESDIPMCRGLGASSAYAVAMCTALMKVFRVSAEPSVIQDWTQPIDIIFHGQPKSSLHSSMAIHGGYIFFRNGKMDSPGVRHHTPMKVMLIDTFLRRDPRAVNAFWLERLSKKIDTMALNDVNELVKQTWRSMNDTNFLPAMIDRELTQAQHKLNLAGIGQAPLTEGVGLDIFNLANQSHMTAKQSQSGETVFLLYDGIEDCDNVRMFRDSLKNLGFTWLDEMISFEGFKVTATENETTFPKLHTWQEEQAHRPTSSSDNNNINQQRH